MVLAFSVASVAFGHGTGPDARGLGPWASVGQAVPAPGVPGRELEELRTRRSRTFERADGSRVARVFEQSVHFRAGDGWEPIRNRLVREGDGDLRNAANRYELSIPERLGEEPLRLEHEGRWLSFALEGAEPSRVSVSGSTASFREVMPGVMARWSAQADAVKEELVLADAQVPRVYRFDVAGSAGLEVERLADGGLAFVNGAGERVFVVPAAFAYDADGFEAPAG